MFYCTRSSGGDHVTKAEILRGVVAEKMTTAAREILAVVERTVAGYEHEAAGFRRELHRLERLLQPERTALIPEDEEGHEVVVLGEEEEEEEEQPAEQSVEDTGSLGLLWFEDEDDGDDEERQRAATTSRRRREDLKDPDYQTSPSCRLIPPRDRSDRRRPGRPRTSDTVLRICVLEDSRTAVLSNAGLFPKIEERRYNRGQNNVFLLLLLVFKKYPVQEVRCPRGLQEEDFLALLRSTFPQLEAQNPFDVFTSDRTKTLQPLKVEALTPEEICRSIRLSGGGNSALYLRLKSREDPQSSTEDLAGLQRPPGAGLQRPPGAGLQRPPGAGLQRPPGAGLQRPPGAGLQRPPGAGLQRPPGAGLQRPPGAGLQRPGATTSADETEAVTGRSFKDKPVGEPPGESSRLSPPSVPFDRRRRGRPRFGEEPTHHVLRVCVLEGLRSNVLPHKVLTKYPVQEVRCPRGLREEDFLLLLRSRVPQLEPQKPFDVFKSDRSRRLQRLQVKTLTPEEIFRTRSPGNKTLIYIRVKQTREEEPEEEEPEEEEELHLSQRSDEGTTMKSDEAKLDSSAVQPEGSGADVPSDQQEVETEALDKDGDWEPESSKRKMKRKGGAKEEQKTACQVCGFGYRVTGSLVKHAWSHVDEARGGVCGVCGERFESADALKGHLKTYKKTHDCSHCRKSFLTAAGLQSHAPLHTGSRPFKCHVCGKAFARASSLSNHRWVHAEEKPFECAACPKAFGLQAQLRAHAKAHAGRDRYRCSVCGKSLYDLRSLTRHKATHSGERRHGCGVCGKRFKLSCTLKSHEKTHAARERTFLCHVCCKTFLSNCSLKAHVRTHSGERPFACAVCGKGFVSNGERTAHARVHTGEAPYGCSQCGRFFKRKTHLSNHVRSHLGIKLYVCTVCGKPCARQEHLTVHMRTHSGERPYECSVCGKAFTQSHCLKTHMRSHDCS
ncbi:zinc finger protein 169-like isoform X3 [Cyclopterus lumpus]|uniref:zinc finger protein 169-like isoform X3 n=1 Tax=Cyclopterus lumpus TaxID=8103 RepID=UPI001486BD1E|nr:zinc finger protein 169-like isoform X3 [Cyclopterus lumpus]